MKKLGLKKETISDLTGDDLRAIAGGSHESHSCTPTFQCVSAGECNSFVCSFVCADAGGGPDLQDIVAGVTTAIGIGIGC